ncbi:MAG: hypothetical protein R2787_00525 [Saprospiraceae bacterium]
MKDLFNIGDHVVHRLLGGRYVVKATKTTAWQNAALGIDHAPNEGDDYIIVGPGQLETDGNWNFFGVSSVHESMIMAVPEPINNTPIGNNETLEHLTPLKEHDDNQEIIVFSKTIVTPDMFANVQSSLQDTNVPLVVFRPDPRLGNRAVCQVIYETGMMNRRSIIGALEDLDLTFRELS